MGTKRLENIAFDEWAQWTPDCREMLAKGWRVRSECRACGVQLHVDLRHVISARGEAFNLWGKTVKCRNLKCKAGVMDFHALPPGGSVWGVMSGHWLARHPLGKVRS